MRTFYLLLLFTCFTIHCLAQSNTIPITVSVFNNGTSLPGTGYAGVFSKTVHPGITLGTYHLYQSKKKHELFQSFKLGYFFHRHAQHAVQLYSELGYRYLTASGFYADAALGAGYLHSFADVQQFKFEDGVYKKKPNLGRPQLMATFAVSAGYDFAKQKLPLRLFAQYQFWMQTPFVKKYVPLLPNTALHLGIIYQWNRTKQTSN